MKNLYEVSKAFVELVALADDVGVDDVAFQNTLEGIEAEFDDICVDVLKTLINYEAEIDALKAEESRLADRRKRIAKSHSGFKQFVLTELSLIHI